MEQSLSLFFHGPDDVAIPNVGDAAQALQAQSGAVSPSAAGQNGGKSLGFKALSADSTVLHVDFETPELMQDFVSKCMGAVQQMHVLAREASAAPTPRRQLSNVGRDQRTVPGQSQSSSDQVPASVVGSLLQRARRAKSAVRQRTPSEPPPGSIPQQSAADQSETLTSLFAEVKAQRDLLNKILQRLDE